MTTAYFECTSGVAGDMLLGSFIDAGMPMAHLARALKKLPLTGYRLAREKRTVHAPIMGVKLHVRVTREAHDARYTSLARLIARSKLTPRVKETSLAIFEQLATAEAKVHRVPLAKVHFHEVGGIDSIVDCVGAAIGFEYFDFASIVASPLPITRGRIRTQHGWLPVPAPATIELLKGVPLEPSPVKGELVTPTGAAILTTMTDCFGACPLQHIERVGYGFGDRVFPEMPNCVQLMIGEGFPMVVVEATIDDMQPQLFEYAMERLFDAGAADVTLQPVHMKKNRIGFVLACQTPWHLKDAAIAVILRETTTLGVRYYPIDRKVLMREMTTVMTKFGRVRVKIAHDKKLGITKRIPEYEDMKRLARAKKVPLLEVYRSLTKKL